MGEALLNLYFVSSRG